jgi:hypothetical protein
MIPLREIPPRGLHWLQPGALHHARWMSTVLYTDKMYAFSEHQSYDLKKMESLRRTCLLNALLCIKFWLSAASAIEAPANDLHLWSDLMWFRKVDPIVADAALSALNRYLWHLTDEIARFSLFSSSASHAEKKQIARQLLQIRMKHLPNWDCRRSHS